MSDISAHLVEQGVPPRLDYVGKAIKRLRTFDHQMKNNESLHFVLFFYFFHTPSWLQLFFALHGYVCMYVGGR